MPHPKEISQACGIEIRKPPRARKRKRDGREKTLGTNRAHTLENRGDGFRRGEIENLRHGESRTAVAQRRHSVAAALRTDRRAGQNRRAFGENRRRNRRAQNRERKGDKGGTFEIRENRRRIRKFRAVESRHRQGCRRRPESAPSAYGGRKPNV